MKYYIFVIILALFSCSVSEDVEELEPANVNAPTEESSYIPPGATVENVGAVLSGCITYTANVQLVSYGGAVNMSPEFGTGSVILDIVPSPYGQTISTYVNAQNPSVFVNSAFLGGKTAYYWRIRVPNSYCWPNPSPWYFKSL